MREFYSPIQPDAELRRFLSDLLVAGELTTQSELTRIAIENDL